MFGRRKRDIGDEAADFGGTLVAFLAALAGVIRSAAEWVGRVGLDRLSNGADVLSEQAGSLARTSKSRAKRVKRRGRRALLNLALVTAFVWWLDRDLSESA